MTAASFLAAVAVLGTESMKPNAMDRFINAIELVAAAFVGLVAADVFISVLLRYFFSIDIPDSYNFGQLLLGILIFWGIAATSYRGTHITVDLVWANVGPKMAARHRRVCDARAAVRGDGADLDPARQDRRAPTPTTCRPRICAFRSGPSTPLAWAGDVSAVILIAVRTYRLIFRPDLMPSGYQIKPID